MIIRIDYEDISNPLYNQRGIDNYILYLHKSPSNKYYVGITCQGIERRWRFDGSGYYKCKYFYRAIKKYGFQNFDHFIIRMNLDEETANECEINMIKNLRDAGFELYNVSNGGKAAFKGMHLSEEHKKKISESNKGRPPTTMSPEGKKRLINSLKGNKNALGYRHSKETRQKISSSLTGKKRAPFTTEHKEHIGESRKGKPLSDAQKDQLERLHKSNVGRKMPQSAIEALIKRNLGHVVTEETRKKTAKPVIQYNLKMEKVKEFISINEAYRQTDTPASSIIRCCKGKLKSANGYIWRYKEEMNESEEYKSNVAN